MASNVSRGGGEVVDEALGKRSEHVVVGDLPSLLRLDPLRPQAMQPAPGLEVRAQPDHVQERPLAHHAPNGGAVVVIEVAVDGDAPSFRKRKSLLDLPSLVIQYFWRL